MNTKLKFKFHYIALFFFFSYFNILWAQIYKNKGPAFVAHKNSLGLLTQKGVVGLYSVWNFDNIHLNYLNQKKIEYRYNKLPNKESLKLKPADIESNLLSFGYKDEDDEYINWNFIGVEYGYCHGMTLLIRQFLYFAKFDEKAEVPIDLSLVKTPEGLKKIYQKKIDDVLKDKTTTFQGIKNLGELSSENLQIDLQTYLKRHIVDQWGINTASISLYKQFANWKPLEVHGVESIVENLKRYLAKGFYPRVVLGAPMHDNTNPHVVLVTNYRIEKTHNEFEYCLRLSYLDVGRVSGSRVIDSEQCLGVGSFVFSTLR